MIAEVIVGTVVAWSALQVMRRPQEPARRHHTISRIPKR